MNQSSKVKFLGEKVAVIYGVTTPIATCFCLKLIEQGARLILIYHDDITPAATLSREMNLLWGGADSNYEGRDPWGAKPIAQHLYIPRTTKHSGLIKEFSLSCFGKVPELIVDIAHGVQSEEIQNLSVEFSQEEQLIGIEALNGTSLWSCGWLGTLPIMENVDPESCLRQITVYTRGHWDLIRDLVSTNEKKLQPGNSREIWFMKTDNLFYVLAYLLHSGMFITTNDFHIHSGTSDKLSVQCSSPNQTLSSVMIEKKKLKAFWEETSYHPDSEEETLLMKTGVCFPSGDKTASVGNYSKEISLEETQSYITTDSDLINNGTFDALLQKTKDYPVDWWQGGSESFVSMDDINCKVMAKAAMNFAVRWLVLGYFVIGFAVPKVLGWNNA